MSPVTTVYDPIVLKALSDAQAAFRDGSGRKLVLNGQEKTIPYPFASPADWRETWIYFLMTDRFNNPVSIPASMQQHPPINWDQRYNFRQGGTFKGIEAQLDYIASLGAGAIWITPVLKNPLPDGPDAPYNYHGYATQDFLTIDGRFASDGTAATATREFTELIAAAHLRGLRVILDIVINHVARVFDYEYKGNVVDSFDDAGILNGPLGDEPPIRWVDRQGKARADWREVLPAAGVSGDDAVWPADLQQHRDFFRRRGNKLSDTAPPGGFAKGDFGSLRQLVAEYDASVAGEETLRNKYGKTPVLEILIQIHAYLIAVFDVDAFRIDTVKYVAPAMVETFCNAIREFALSIGKRNFFTFGEIYDDEATIERFVGRNSTNTDGFGMDAALDFPLFYVLPAVAKSFEDVATVRQVFDNRKRAEEKLISSHGEAGKYFVSFLDNHDQNQRFNHPGTPPEQVLTGLAVLFCLQGIPCLYYGTEQGLDGTKHPDGTADTNSPESVREALWGKGQAAFDPHTFFCQQLSLLGALRKNEPALQSGRLYFREVAGNGRDFGLSQGVGGVLAFSRVLFNREVLIVANTSTSTAFPGFVVVDADINRALPAMKVAYSNVGTAGQGQVQFIPGARFFKNGVLTDTRAAAALFVVLKPMEVQVLVRV